MTTDTTDTISKALDLRPLSEVVAPAATSPTLPAPPTGPESYVQDDYEFSRKVLREVMEQGVNILTDAALVARQGQDPDSFSASAAVLKSITDAAKSLLDINAVHNKLTGVSPEAPTTVNNNLFVGSTAEMQKIAKELFKE